MIRAAKGFRMRRSKLYRYASDAVDHGRQYAYRDRRTKKRNFRALWQIRINAAARAAGVTYSRFMEGLKAAKVALDRKVLADLAAQDNAAFGELVKIAQNALKTKAAAKADAAAAFSGAVPVPALRRVRSKLPHRHIGGLCNLGHPRHEQRVRWLVFLH